MAKAMHLDPTALVKRNHRRDLIFGIGGVISLVIALGLLLALIGDLVVDGAGRISWDFLTSFPSRRAARAGILSAWVGTSLVMLVTPAYRKRTRSRRCMASPCEVASRMG